MHCNNGKILYSVLREGDLSKDVTSNGLVTGLEK